MHGAGSQSPWNGYIRERSRVLNEAGIATFNVDSYSGRGIFDVRRAVAHRNRGSLLIVCNAATPAIGIEN